MPSTKVFAAVLAALAMPMVNAGPCKPVKPVTTSGSTDAIITTTGLTTGGTEAATGTTEIVATTTAAAACTHFTPLVPQPADCGKKGFASNDEGKTIGLPIIAETSADCGNKCGMTVGCKSFSHIATTCSLFKVPVSELGFVESQQSMTALFYDLENCFGCGDEPGATSATSAAETGTGSETATSAVNTATSGVETATSGAETATSGDNTATSGVETATAGIETATSGAETATSGSETATSGAETATSGTETATSGTETAATGSPTETSATSGAQADTTTATAAGTTDTAVTTTAAATTTTDAACTAYTLVPNAPATNCAKKGKAITPQIIQTETVEDLDACSLKCGNYVNDLLPSVVCRSFSFKASTNSCTLYKVKISDMNVVSCSITDEQDFYDFDVCYSCQEGGASTTEAATTTAQSAATTETAGTTTTATTTSVDAGVSTTTAGTTTAAESTGTTTAAESTGTTTAVESTGTTTAAESTGTTTAAESTGTTTAAESTGTTTAAESVGTTTTAEAAGTTTTADAGVSTTAAETTTAQSTTEGITTTTEGITTTTEAATTTAEPTTTTAAPVCTNYIIKPNAPSSCGKQGKVSCRSNQKLGQPSTSESSAACGKTCGNTDGCKAFSWTYKLRSQSTCQLYSAPLSELSFTPCNTGTKFYDLDTCFTCSNTPTPNPPTPNPPATCSKYVPTFETCSKDTHCGTRGEICNETRIYTTVDNSCLENCAKSCIQYGAECKYFSYKAADMFGAAKCKLYKAGKITYKSYSSTKFYEQKCFKCKETLAVKKAT
ncbi:hypothetical protein BKA59DRAFT_394657 [Fusarium tricinctum]|uniref:Apple domain-containing protein n=1 Tax=Fusarium tricinctum TaxID=61284 RepID=A0A8K0WEG4_9HYPO|nr:hypothetical protein BKA59DRAFT_394657 [Fusarium tricinctum]